MDDELLKRNTDCVYFLASPFTCRKGVECEYRHSEMARLNPRDCKYWLYGNCLNPICGFRHPPVDMDMKAQTEAELSLNSSFFPPRKNNVTCYFYSNKYFCNKGDQCPFLHGPEDLSVSKQEDSTVVGAPSTDDRKRPDLSNHIIPDELLNDKLQTKTSYAKPVLDPPENYPAMLKRIPKAAREDPLPQKKYADISNTLARRDSPRSSEFEYKDASISMPESLNPDNVIKSDPSVSSDQFSENISNVAQDEWWGSSSDSDALAEERRPKAIAAAEDQEAYMPYEDCYSYRDQQVLRMHEPYADNEDRIDIVGYFDRDSGRNHNLSRKRRLMNVGLTSGGRYDEDLREHLTKLRSFDGCSVRGQRYASKRYNLPFISKERWGKPYRRNSSQNLHGRLALDHDKDRFGLPMQNSSLIVPNPRRQFGNSQLNRHNHHKQKKQKFCSSGPRSTFSRRKGENGNTISFSGPKSLAQIKEEKCRPKADSIGHSSQSISVGFEGPKPLNELLKDKQKLNNGDSPLT